MVHIVGAGSGAPDLITLRGAELLRKAQVVIYAGSLVNPSLLGLCGPDCRLYNSAHLTLEEVLEVIRQDYIRTARAKTCTHASRTLYAGFPHFHFYANPTFAVRFLDACRKESFRHAGAAETHGH